jgi:hypothetical protein
MPHALAMPPSSFQAVILCGPGVSLNTFTSTPDEFPKALVPIANRPMIWYPLDWCYRMGITSRCHLATLSHTSLFYYWKNEFVLVVYIFSGTTYLPKDQCPIIVLYRRLETLVVHWISARRSSQAISLPTRISLEFTFSPRSIL